MKPCFSHRIALLLWSILVAGLISCSRPEPLKDAEMPPSVGSMTPNPLVGRQQVVTISISHPGGTDKIKSTQLMIGANLSDSEACWIRYSPDSNRFDAMDGQTHQWIGATANTSTVKTAACTLDIAKSAVNRDRTTSQLTFSIELAESFTLPKTVFAIASTAASHSGWKTVGAWNR
jgi:hypothetical protein